MRKRFWIPLALASVAAIGFFGIAPGYIEGSMNVVDGKPLIKVSDEARALHQTLAIVDLHSDSLMWDRDITHRAERGHMDLPRLQQGNVALQLFSSVTKTPKGQNYDANGADTDNITLLTIEGLHNLEGKAANLDRLYDAGFRMAGLTHFFDNELGGSMHGLKKGGLTPFGRDIVQRMEAKGMIVDIAHLSHTGVAEVLAMATRPVVSSHGGVQATCKVNRNLTDEEIRGVAKTGGVIGIGYWEGAVCSTDPRASAKAMKHVRDLVGIDYVALGSDYDGATTVRFDTSQLVQVTQALMDEGFAAEEIAKVMGGNALRVIRAGIVPAVEMSAAK